MITVNYISGGKWHVKKKRDLFAVYEVLMSFYKENIRPLYREDVGNFVLDYDRELQMMRVAKSSSSGLIRADERKLLLSENKKLAMNVRHLFDTLTAMGTVSAPFNNIRLQVSTKIKSPDDLKSKAFLLSESKSANGYYSLSGRLV